MTLAEYCSNLDAVLKGAASDDERLERMAGAIGQLFRVTLDEVAIFMFDREQEMIRFIWPVRLKNAGALPLSAHASLVARTVRDNRTYLDNSFSTTPHASIFELFRLGPEHPPAPIQKIMSAPAVCDGVIRGVVQVSRKGRTSDDAGRDFTPDELAALASVAEVVARHIARPSPP
jgi:GAF domain-containing protein